MLKIFEQIFHRDAPRTRSHPDELIQRATERAVDATDPRIRILPSYRKKLRPAVIHAIDHAVQLVEALSRPVPMSAADWEEQPVLGAMFASAQSMRTALSCDGAYRDFVALNPQLAEPVSALLLAEVSLKQTYGYDVVDDKPVSDVPLTVISFDEHRLIGLATHAPETRRLLQLRAFDYLLMQALTEVTAVKDHREELVGRKRLLRTKLDIVARSSGNLTQEPRREDRTSLQKKMDEVEAALSEAGADDTVLQKNLEIVAATLAGAEQCLRLEQRTLYLDNMHYLRTVNHPRAVELPIQVLCDARAREMAAQLIMLRP
jgi:hypothetical protein